MKHPYQNDEVKDIKLCFFGDQIILSHPNHPPYVIEKLRELKIIPYKEDRYIYENGKLVCKIENEYKEKKDV